MPDLSKFSTIIQTKVQPFLRSTPGKIALGVIAAILAVLLLSHSFSKGGGIEDIAREQLTEIKNGDIGKAYNLTSTVFQQKNSFDVFSGYIQGNDIFKQYDKVSFNENRIDSGVGYLKGTLIGGDGSKEGIEIQLVKEEGQWKVQVFQLTGAEEAAGAPGSETGAADSSGAMIHDLLISDSADLDGYVEDVKLTLPSSAQKIYVTAEMVAPSSGTGAKIQAVLHLPGLHGKIGPTVGDVTGSGSVLKAFSFTRSASSWPTGEYSVTVTLSTGATMTQKFRVE